MFGGIDPKQMASMMKKMGIKTENIIAEEVIIRGPKTIIIKEPSVTVMDVQGQKTFQIMGRIEEMKEDSGDIKLIMEQSGSSKEEAEQALEESQGNIAEAILKLKKR